MRQTLNEITEDGDKYVAVDGGGDCTGCALYDENGEYKCLQHSGSTYCGALREDGRSVIWVKKENQTESASGNKGVKSDQREHSHYFKDVRHLDFIDVYRVIDLWELKDPALQHALKKLLVPGNRGHKDIQKDVQDVIDSCKRWQEMQAENGTKESV